MVKAAYFRNLDHCTALWRLHCASLGCVLIQRQVRPRTVIVAQELANNPPQVSFTENDDMVETFSAQGPDYPLHVRRLPKTAWSDDNLLDLKGPHLVSEHPRVDSIRPHAGIFLRRKI